MSNRLPRRSRKKSAGVDPTRIGQLLRLALSSDQDGEAIAAIAALKRSLAAAGLDLHDLAGAAERGLQPQQQQPPQQQRQTTWGPPPPDPGNWQSLAWFAHYHADHLTRTEREFVADMLLGQGDGFDCGRICDWAVQELR